MNLLKRLFVSAIAVLLLSGCTTKRPIGLMGSEGQITASKPALADNFLQSGTIVLSRQLPGSVNSEADLVASAPESDLMAPLLGYLPPTEGFLPAENETWLQIDSASRTIEVYRGQTLVKDIHGEGVISLQPGTYSLQHKQKRPLWYASDDYFVKRQLPVPPAGDRARYRRGALGTFVLYPTVAFPIHSGPIWSEDVGGIRVSRADLSSIYYILPVGTNVVVK